MSLAVGILGSNMQGPSGLMHADCFSPQWKAKYIGRVSDVTRCQSLCYSLDTGILSTEEIIEYC